MDMSTLTACQHETLDFLRKDTTLSDSPIQEHEARALRLVKWREDLRHARYKDARSMVPGYDTPEGELSLEQWHRMSKYLQDSAIAQFEALVTLSTQEQREKAWPATAGSW